MHAGERLAAAGKELELVGAKEDLAPCAPARTRLDLRDVKQDAAGSGRQLCCVQAVGRDIHLQMAITEGQAGRLHRDLPDMRGRAAWWEASAQRWAHICP